MNLFSITCKMMFGNWYYKPY